MRSLTLSIIFIASSAQGMPSSSYLQDVSQSSETLKQAQLIRKKAKADYEFADSLWRTGLGAQAGYLDSRVATSTSSYGQTGIQSEASVTQNSSLGLTAAFTATLFEDDDRAASEAFSVDIEQKLWRNAFGGADRAGLKASEKSYQADLTEADLKTFEACDLAYSVYFNTWVAQEKLHILKDVLKLAKQSFSMTRRNYQRKLIRKLEFESANVDFLDVQDRVLAAENDWTRESNHFKRYSVLSEPLNYNFAAVPLESSKSLLRAEVLKLRFEALELQKYKEKSKSRTDVSLFATANVSEEPLAAGPGFTDSESYLVGLRFDFPFLDKRPNAQYKSALANAGRAQQVWIKQEGDERVRLNYETDLLKEIELKLEKQHKRFELRASQVKRALKYLNSGKLEFDDYLRYRNGELEERLRGLDLIKSYWDTRLDILQSTGDGAKKLCGAFLSA